MLPAVLILDRAWHKKVPRSGVKSTPGGTRTRNPQIRSLMRYPLRHWGTPALQYQRVATPPDGMAQRQRIGFQTQRLGVRIPLPSLFLFCPALRPQMHIFK